MASDPAGELETDFEAELVRLARRRSGGDDALADDLAQVGRIAAWHALDGWSEATGVPRRPWVLLRVKWRMVDYIRGERRRPPTDELTEQLVDLTPWSIEGQVEARAVLEQLGQLPEPLRTAGLDLLLDVPTQDTARRLRVSVRHVRRYRDTVARILSRSR